MFIHPIVWNKVGKDIKLHCSKWSSTISYTQIYKLKPFTYQSVRRLLFTGKSRREKENGRFCGESLFIIPLRNCFILFFLNTIEWNKLIQNALVYEVNQESYQIAPFFIRGRVDFLCAFFRGGLMFGYAFLCLCIFSFVFCFFCHFFSFCWGYFGGLMFLF